MAHVVDGILWTLAMNGALGLAGYLVARHGLRVEPGLPRGLAAAVVAWAWATAGMLILGSVGGFSRAPLLGWSTLGVLGGLCLRRFRGEAADRGQEGCPGEGTLRWEGTIAVGLLLWATANFGFRSLWLPVKVVSDGPIYHLWFAARWWKEGRLFLVAAPFGESVATYFPCGGDVWFGWLMVGWGGELLAKIGQMPFLLLAWLAVYATARQLGVKATAAAIACCWFATATSFQVFNAEPNVDTIFTAAYVVSVYFFVRFGKGGAWSDLLLGALAAGLCWGTKPSGLVFVPPLLLLVSAMVVCRRAKPGWKAAQLSVLALGTLSMAGWWYGANAMRTGNPLYPLQIELMGRRIFTGWYGRDVMRLSPYYLDPSDVDALVDMILQVFAPRLVPFWLAGLLGVWAIGRGKDGTGGGSRGWLIFLSALVGLNIAIYWLAIPYRTQQRFLFHALALAAIPLGAFQGHWRGLTIGGTALLALHVLTPSAWPWVGVHGEGMIPWDRSPLIPSILPAPVNLPLTRTEWRGLLERLGAARGFRDMYYLALPTVSPLVVGLGSMFVAFALSRALRQASWIGWSRAMGAIVGFLVVGSILFFPWGASRATRFYPFFEDYYRGWLALDRLSGPEGARIAYAGTNLPYYLLGPGLRNQVRYVNVDEHRGWLMHNYHRRAVEQGKPNWPGPRPEWDRLHPRYEDWMENLAAEGIELVVVARHNPQEEWPIERAWAEGHSETFRAAYGVQENDPLFRVYRLGGRGVRGSTSRK